VAKHGQVAAKLAVDTAALAIDKPYDYIVPPRLAGSVRPGARVLVPFGRGNRVRGAVVLALTEPEPGVKLKTILALLDESPVLDEKELKMALWLRERCFCTLFEAVKAILPHGLWFQLKETWRLTAADRETAYAAAGRSTLRTKLLDILYENGGQATEEQLRVATGGKDPGTALRELENAGVLERDTRVNRIARDKSIEIVTLAVDSEDALDFSRRRSKIAPAQAEAVRILAEIGAASLKELSYFSGASAASIRAVGKYGIITISEQETYRLPRREAAGKAPPLELSRDQQRAFDGLLELLERGGAAAALLRGVTGSGKTAVYIRLIQSALDRGRTALVLVPEIALTPGLLYEFARYFGDSVAVAHSALRTGERYDLWKRIKYTDEVKVVLGTRSAVFSPLKNLGLIIIDEEQEGTYKSETSPRYHARDVAKYRCLASGALLVLGSATPSIETMYSARSGKYSYFELPERFNRQPLPEVIISDMKKELLEGSGGTLSKPLVSELEKNIGAGEQSILFINRRGSSRLQACGECGFVHFCPRCSVAMTYHSANRRLMCHYCGHSETLMEQCPECGGKMKYVGAGTQKVEEELLSIFPGIETIRMDTDTVGIEGSHDRILKRFEKEKIPVLIGTQMVTKGLDFPNVTLVGVIAADLSLYMDDFRSYERTFSLITQVVGRAGRGGKSGRAVIQTFTPGNEVIRFASSQDYEAFYESEIMIRKARGLPPFSDILTVTASGLTEMNVIMCCTSFRDRLEECLRMDYKDLPMQILGPAPLSVVRVNNRFRYKVTMLTANNKRVRALIGALVKEFKSNPRFSDVALFADTE